MLEAVTSPDSPALPALCDHLRDAAAETDATGAWPVEQLRLCGEAGVFRWFLPEAFGGYAWDNESVVRGYLALSGACLATTFAITQRTAACRRIALCGNDALKQLLLPDLASGATFATVGISHLTTSGRHLDKPRLAAERIDNGWRLHGTAPWVTGGVAADTLVVGATVVANGVATHDEVLIALPRSTPGVTAADPFPLVALSASCTGAVRFDNVIAGDDLLMAGPTENVLASLGRKTSTGGHETSTLAIGLTAAAIAYLQTEADKRPDLAGVCDSLHADHQELVADLLALTRGESVCTNDSLRTRANSLVLRATQAALGAAKGAGYVAGHPVGRWCREALFFLVWSCPQPVVEANLCELAGIE